MHEYSQASTSPRRIRQRNVSAALQALFDHKRLSRADLSRLIGLNRSSSGHIVAELAASGLAREVPEDVPGRKEAGRTGRPGIMLELVADAAVFLGAEIGVEHVTTVLIDLSANIVDCRVAPFDGRATAPRDAVARATAQAVDGLAPDLLDRVEGFGLAVPGQLDRSGAIALAPILGWRNEDIAAITREVLPIDAPIMVENEANAFAFGESYRNPAARTGVTLFLVLETGVGGGIVIDGRLFRGGNGLAGEIGHMPDPDGGEVEQTIGLERLLGGHVGDGGAGPALSRFLDAVRDREPRAVAAAEDWARGLARAIVTASRLIDPNRVVLGGSVAALYPLVAARVAHYARAMQAETFTLPEIEVHESAEAGAGFGAACMLHRKFIAADDEPPTLGARDRACGSHPT